MSNTKGTEDFYFLKTKVASYQLDKNKKLSIVAIAELMQEAAGMHSNSGGFGYKQVIEKSLVWVLNALRIEISKSPAWDDEIIIKTWIVESNKFLSRRDFQFINNSGEVIIAGSTVWILYNILTKRPQNIKAMNFEVKEYNNIFAVKESIKNTKPQLNGELSGTYKVKYSDLDMVGHLNNTRYIRAIIDSYDFKHYEKLELESLEIHFKQEAKYGENLSIYSELKSKLNYYNDIRNTDNKSICFAKLAWVNKIID